MLRIQFPKKNSVGANVYRPQRGARGLERFPCLKYNVLTRKNRLTLGQNIAKNSDFMKKKLKVKVVDNSIPYKKLPERTCLSTPRVELGCSKDCRVEIQLAKKGSATVSKGKRMLLFLIQWLILNKILGRFICVGIG